MAIDFSIASTLILLSKLIRIKVTLVQRLYVPVALMAGIIALILGENGLALLPFLHVGSYAGLLIAIIFACLGLSTKLPAWEVLIKRTGRLWVFNQLIMVSQYLLATLLGTYVLGLIWPKLPAAFAIIMPAGFMGGHGTAAAVGNTLTKLGWNGALSMALTMATVGVFLAVLGGMVIINLISRLGVVTHIKKFEDLELHFRQGLIPEGKRESLGVETVSSSSINTLTLHISLIAIVVGAAYWTSNNLSSLSTGISVPVFACAFLYGYLARGLLEKTGYVVHFDSKIFAMSAGSATDYLVFFGIASIKISIVLLYLAPLLFMISTGLILCLVLTFVVAPWLFGSNWVEKGIFSWGWMTGTVAMGILLLRIVDPEGRSKVLDDYAISYVPTSFVEITLVAFLPVLVMEGNVAVAISIMCLYLLLVLCVGAKIRERQ